MDEIVRRAMARWPDVPAVYGWLSLDRRGRYLIKGEAISNRAAVEFIARNYAVDAHGRWFFQNGPQRVYVRLERTPFVLRLEIDGRVTDHTARTWDRVTAVCMDETGSVLLASAHGVGVLDDRDLDAFSERLRGGGGERLDEETLSARLDALAAGRHAALTVELDGAVLPVTLVASADAPARFGFDPDPEPEP